ncbi:MAG TPA: signal recognition particle protein [Thermoanaerobaculia bacterium]|jgi:signal recognition particle subunit SRP54|nr:signal recognition particle protein [Thermoanaerobaculia bacterium]
MFDGLQGKLQAVFRDLRGEGRITPEVLEEALKQIRMALLEADVHFRVVKAFVDRVRERSSNEEVLQSLTGSQQVVKIVRDELVALLGDEGAELRLDGRPAVVLLCGLQGSGKTTTAGKLAKRLRGRGRHPLLVAGDLQRAAAVEQLVQVGRGVGVPVVAPEAGEKVDQLAERALKVARDRGHDVMVFDTAGRLHVDEALMAEVKRLAERLKPSETLFVADAMTGQDAVKSAGAFAAALPLTGAILTKLDGDSRGGAALSIRTVAKVPIRFAGTGEKSDDLELFSPDRMAGRILGMGDVLSLIERAERELDQGETQRLAGRIGSGQLTLEDVRDQMRQIRKLGSMSQILEMLPKVGPLRGLDAMKVDDGQLKRVEAIIDSMTPLERRRPQVLDGSRKKRIASGSGTHVQEINQLLKQYQQMQKMMKGGQGKMLRRLMAGRRA